MRAVAAYSASVVMLVLLLGAGRVAGQPVQGVVWQVPSSTTQALRELDSLSATGVQALRVGLVADTTVLVRADSLGLQLYQEVPLDYLPAALLRDTLEAARRMLQPVLRRASGHPSARNFGLARRSDTSDSTACAYFQALTDLVHGEGPPGARTYYLSSFADADRCAASVDFVLLDALDEADPAAMLRRRHAADSLQPTAGIGALGTYVDPAADRGLRQAHSPQWQARFLENALGTLLADTLARRPLAVFVYRWRDEHRALPLQARGMDLPARRHYGLHRTDGTLRPARRVVEGFYTGRQTVFAFDAGDAPTEPFPWFILMGWAVFAGVGLSYSLSARMRRMTPRYFTASGFYRDAVREGRELMEGSTTTLFALLAVSVGIIIAVTVEVASHHAAFWIGMRWLPEGAHETVLAFVEQPWLLILSVAAVYVAFGLLWVGLLALLTRGRRGLTTGQALVLLVWPRWTYLLAMTGALVVSTMPPGEALQALPYLVGAAFVFQLYATVRTLLDYKAVALVPPSRLVAAAGLNAFFLLLVFLFFASLQYRYEVTFLWHLVTRS